MKILVTGCNGFVGRHAVAAFRAAGHDACGGDVAGTPPPDLPYLPFDATSPDSIRAALETFAPDAILHLGGIAFVPVAWEHPQMVFQVNTVGPLNVLDAVRTLRPATRLLLVTSAEVYGSAPAAGAAFTEDSPLAPDNIYGVTKAAADTAARFYAARHGLPLLVARPANHIGPGQSPRFVSSAFARQLADIAAGRAPAEMRVGNLDSRRNFTDVRDVVRAYLLLLERGTPGAAYNIASPSSVSIRDLLDALCDISGVRPSLAVDPALWRPTDAHPAYSTDRLRADTGWTPRIPLRQTLTDLYRSIAEA